MRHLPPADRRGVPRYEPSLLPEAVVLLPHVGRDGLAQGQVEALVVPHRLIDQPDACREGGVVLGPLLDGQMAAVEASDSDSAGDDGTLCPALGQAAGLVFVGGDEEFQLQTNVADEVGQVDPVGGFGQEAGRLSRGDVRGLGVRRRGGGWRG